MRPISHTLLYTLLLLTGGNLALAQSNTRLNLTGAQAREAISFKSKEQKIEVCGLKPGKTYQVWINEPGSKPSIRIFGSTHDFAATLFFTASQECHQFLARKGEHPISKSNSNAWFSISCKDCIKQGNPSQFSKIATQGALSPQTLLNDIFLGGSCYEVSNLSAIGVGNGRGSFTDGNSTIGIPNGVILCTGDISDAAGPNNDDQAGLNIGGPTTDPDLEIYATANIQDVQGIEFDFVPTGTTVSFDYVFASEEYCEFVNTGMNDLFGFFISGPGINGSFSFNGENLAVVPTTNLYVTIDNVNQIDNSAFFVPNRPNCGATTNMADIQYDGWTTVLTATANVIPCEQYHIRLVIADVGDGIFDSAVFLGAGSFDAGGDPESGNIEPSAGTLNYAEGCEQAEFIFYRDADSDITKEVPINLTLLPSSTATEGVDFMALPTTVIIPAGQDSIVLPVTVIDDNITEGVESIQISVANGCNCASQAYSLTLTDPPLFTATLPVVQVCAGTSVSLMPTIAGGIPGSDYSYQWNNGSITPSIEVFPSDGDTISVSITDKCGTEVQVNTIAEVIEIPTLTLSAGSGNICLGDANDSHTITLEINGQPDWLVGYTLDGQAQNPLPVTSSPFDFNTNTPGNYIFTSVTTATANCVGIATGEANIFLGDIQNNVTTTPINCISTGSMTVATTGGTAPYNYTWSSGSPNAPTATGLPEGNYAVTVSDANGCTSLANGTIVAVQPISVNATATSVDCNAPEIGTINLALNGGTAPFSFTWSNGLPATQNQTGLGAGTYTVTVSDGGGCNEVATATVVATSVPPLAVAQATDSLDCAATTITITGQGSQTGNNINYQWSGPGIVGSDDMLDIVVDAGGTYTLTVTNTSDGCTNTATVEVAVDQTPPVAIAQGGTLTCIDSTVVLNGLGSSQGANFTYDWGGAGIVAGGNTLTPTANLQGNYTLIVTNENNHCSTTATALVGLDDIAPSSTIEAPDELDCNVTSIVLDGSASSTGAVFNYQWNFNGVPISSASTATLWVENPGNYGLMVTNSVNGCSSEAMVLVQENVQQPQVTASVIGQLDCAQNAVELLGEVQGNPIGLGFQWTTPNGVFDGSTAAQNATAVAPGFYTLVVTDLDNGCTDTASVQVLQSNQMPTVSITSNGNLNCTTESITLDGTASSQGPNYSFVWSTSNGSFQSGQNSLTPIVNGAGTYILTIFDSNNNCQTQGSITITLEDDLPTIAIPTPPLIDCDNPQVTIGANIGNIPPNSNLSYNWSTSDGAISGPVDGASVTATEAGNYLLTVTNLANGCSSSADVLVMANLNLPIVNIAPASAINCNDSLVVLNAMASSQGSDFSYQWTTLDGVIIGNPLTLNPIVGSSGTYNLFITNNLNNCTSTGQITVVEDLAHPVAVAQVVGTLTCTLEELNLSGTGSSTGDDFEYNWVGPGILDGSNTLSPLVNTAGDYQLTVTNLQNGCSSTDVVTLQENTTAPIAEAGANGELTCQLNSLQLDGNGSSVGPNFIYQWSSLNGNIVNGVSSLQPFVDAAGSYELLVTDTLNGCSAIDVVQVTQDDDAPSIVIAPAPLLTCIVEEIALDAIGTSTGSEFVYNWTTQNGFIVSGGDGLQPIVNQPGMYQLQVTDTNTNCTNTANVLVGGNTTLPAAFAGQDDQLDCVETILVLNGSGSETGLGIVYQWSTTDGNIILNATTLTPTIDAPGTYQLLVTDTVTGCTNTDFVLVGEDVAIPVAIAVAPDTLDCLVNMVDLSGLGSSTGPQFLYSWATQNGNILNGGNSLNPTVTEPGTYVLTVTNSANSCSETADVVVIENIGNPVATANPNGQIDCNNGSVSLNSLGSSNGSNFNFQWSTSTGNIVSGANTPNPIVDEAGTYQLTVTNSENGCSSTADAVVIADLTEPEVSIANPGQLNCVVNQIELQGAVIQGTNLSFQWTTTDGNILTGETTLSPIVDEVGEYFLLVTNNVNGCTSETRATVNLDTLSPVADAGMPFLLGCNGQNNTLDGSGSIGTSALNYAWSTVDGIISAGGNTANPTISEPGIYQLIVTQASNGCTAMDNVEVDAAFPIATPLVTQPLCSDLEGNIEFVDVVGGMPPYFFSINGGNSFSSEPLFTNLTPSNYELVVQDANGCSQTATVAIEAPAQLELDIEPIVLVDLGDSISLNVGVNIPTSEISSIEWTNSEFLSCADCLNPMTMPLQTISFVVTVIDNNGCEDTAPITVLVKKSNDVYVPNAFSPNDDGINDKFLVFSNLDLPVKVNRFMVFSRWGESLFEQFDFMANDLNYGWDGYHKGEPMDPAVFAWYAEVEFLDGSKQLLKGDVTLVK